MSKRNGNYIGIYNGGQFWVVDPRVEDVGFEEIAHALAFNVRFNGHVSKFWSVAQHSLLVAEILLDMYGEMENISKLNKDKLVLLGLAHDFSEAYMSDIARPIKEYAKDYLVYEEKLQSVLYEAVGITEITPEEKGLLDKADNLALAAEAITLMSPCEHWLNTPVFEDKQYEKYTHLVKVECIDIVKTNLLELLFTAMDNMGFRNEYKNNGRLREVMLGKTFGKPILKNGEVEYVVTELKFSADILRNGGYKSSVDIKALRNSLDISEL